MRHLAQGKGIKLYNATSENKFIGTQHNQTVVAAFEIVQFKTSTKVKSFLTFVSCLFAYDYKYFEYVFPQ